MRLPGMVSDLHVQWCPSIRLTPTDATGTPHTTPLSQFCVHRSGLHRLMRRLDREREAYLDLCPSIRLTPTDATCALGQGLALLRGVHRSGLHRLMRPLQPPIIYHHPTCPSIRLTPTDATRALSPAEHLSILCPSIRLTPTDATRCSPRSRLPSWRVHRSGLHRLMRRVIAT